MATLFTFWPPGPEARVARTVMALAGTRTVSLRTIERNASFPREPSSRLVLLGGLEAHVAIRLDGQGDEVGPAADGAILGEGLATARARVHEQLALFTAERAGICHGPYSKVDLRVDLAAIEGLSEAARRRLLRLAAHRLDAAGRLVVTSQVTRTQSQNLEDARVKVRDLITAALIPPKPRRAPPVRPARPVSSGSPASSDVAS